MVRKYSGPLQKGKRSAYVPGGRKNKPRRHFAKLAKKTPLSNRQYTQVKQIIKGRKEIKFGTFYEYDNLGGYDGQLTNPIINPVVFPFVNAPQSDSAAFTILQTGFNLNAPSITMNNDVAGSVHKIGGYHMAKGDTSTTRDGDYMRLHSHKVMINISMLNNVTDNENVESDYPLKFQIYQIRAKQLPQGTSPSLTGGLFLGPQNQINGIGDLDCSTFQLQNLYKINREMWHVDASKTFILQNPPLTGLNNNSTTLQSGKRYPTNRRCSFWMNKPKKALRFTNGTSTSGLNLEPENVNLVTYIVVVASRVGQNSTDVATTSNRFANRWQMSTCGISKFVDM